ncbi:hypothetical protein WOSG25_041180 [Weissella oryzae SG25]|uniref:Uncharacterized protein n=1 Tax=Weissella oryzae (strain DSM 25784 / JCM 18191 / LMG 30913 / SG25) TaxID=1329250 RepID=A0A069CTW5_WEIOS|nr:hypothetical protein [Weissella oryzae]GAK30678.1 hypothetical protein WOSG25_041180 [Weissella oryzae SG25]
MGKYLLDDKQKAMNTKHQDADKVKTTVSKADKVAQLRAQYLKTKSK